MIEHRRMAILLKSKTQQTLQMEFCGVWKIMERDLSKMQEEK